MHSNRKFIVTVASLLAAIILGIGSMSSDANAKPKKDKTVKHDVYEQSLPADTNLVNQYNQVVGVVQGGTGILLKGYDPRGIAKPRFATPTNASTTQPTASSSYTNQQTQSLKETDKGLNIGLVKLPGDGGTALALGAHIGSHSIQFSSNELATVAAGMQNGNGVSYFGNNGVNNGLYGNAFRPPCYSQYAVSQLAPLYLYSEESKNTTLRLRDTDGNEFEVPVQGCSQRDGNGTIVLLPVNMVYSFKLEASGWDTRPLVVPNPYNAGWKRAPNGQSVAAIMPLSPYTSERCNCTQFSAR